MVFAVNSRDVGKVDIHGVEFDCMPDHGARYSVASNGQYTWGYPFTPYQMEVLINKGTDKHPDYIAYIVDNQGYLWILSGDRIELMSESWSLNYIYFWDYENYGDVENLVKNKG